MIKMYSKENCPNCDHARKMLVNKNMPFEEIKIDQDTSSKQWLVEQGFRSVPQIWDSQGTYIGGYVDLKKYFEKENVNAY